MYRQNVFKRGILLSYTTRILRRWSLPAYEEAVPNDGYVAVDGVYTEMEYDDSTRSMNTSWWSRKRIVILVLFLLVRLGGITCAVIFPMGLVLNSGGSNPLADSAQCLPAPLRLFL